MLRLLGDAATEPMFLLLVACGAIHTALGNRSEALMLLGFVFVVMGISFVQQRRTEHSLEALLFLVTGGLGGAHTPIQNETRSVVRRMAAVGLLYSASLAVAYWGPVLAMRCMSCRPG